MRKQIVDVKKTFNSEVATQSLLTYFPWIDRWQINVSVGMIDTIGDLLTQIEGILGSPPKLSFFRIVEDQVHDEIYQHQISVFFTSRTRDNAKIKALTHAINRANISSKSCCHRCGHLLLTKDVRSEDALRKYPYLAFLDNGDHRHTYNVCMFCCERDWRKAQADAGINPFAKILQNHEITPIVAEPQEQEDNAKQSLVAIYKISDLNNLEQDYQDGPRDQVNRVKAVVKKIKKTSNKKRLATIPDDWRTFCDDLTQRFPNFHRVIRFMRNQLALSSVGDGTLSVSPCLMVGGPGIGKSHFMFSVANELKTKLEIINVSGLQTGSGLSGSESYWSNSQPGTLFASLIYGEIASPIIMLDELDKANDVSYKPLAALHQLLEPNQARCFYDLSVPELPFDASHVIWMATANSLDTIEKPIIDRFNVFHIAEPTKRQMAIIAKNQYEHFLKNHPSGGYFEEQLSDEALEQLNLYHPRKVRKILESAFGSAAEAQRRYLTVSDIRESDLDEHDDDKNGIGFMATIL